MDRVALTRSDAVVSLTEHFLRELHHMDWQPRREAVIPDAFDANMYQPQDRAPARQLIGLAVEQFVIVYAGMTFAHRGLDRLVHAFATAHLPTAKLIFVGGRPAEVAALREQVASLNLDEQVEFIMPQPQPMVAQYLAAADILAIPDTVTDVTASPLKLFEYMAMGRPIITVDLPALREVIDEQAARFVRRGDVGDLRMALEELASDPARREQMGRAAVEQSRPWTYQRRAERIIKLARELLPPSEA
jgi:glycosyltransferase involved in cell wall biosynthesis